MPLTCLKNAWAHKTVWFHTIHVKQGGPQHKMEELEAHREGLLKTSGCFQSEKTTDSWPATDKQYDNETISKLLPV